METERNVTTFSKYFPTEIGFRGQKWKILNSARVSGKLLFKRRILGDSCIIQNRELKYFCTFGLWDFLLNKRRWKNLWMAWDFLKRSPLLFFKACIIWFFSILSVLTKKTEDRKMSGFKMYGNSSLHLDTDFRICDGTFFTIYIYAVLMT